MRQARVAVLALDGDTLVRDEQAGTQREQLRVARSAAAAVLHLLREGWRVVVVAGDGGHLDRELTRGEEAATKLPPRPLDAAAAASAGMAADLLVRELNGQMKRRGPRRPVTSLGLHVLVSRQDPTFELPVRAVGPYVSGWRARELSRGGWKLAEEPPLGWRRIVASPRPLDVFEIASVEALVNADHLVVTGGGGIPLAVDGRGELQGVEAVIDEAHTAALLGAHLEAELLVLLGPAEHLHAGVGRPDQAPVERIQASDLAALRGEGAFADERTGARVDAALYFLQDGGAAALLTNADKLAAALADRAGTRILRAPSVATARRQLDLFAAPTAADADNDEESP
jgi:carbamate kinase